MSAWGFVCGVYVEETDIETHHPLAGTYREAIHESIPQFHLH